MEENASLSEDEGDEEVHPAGDLPEGLQDMGDQMEDRPEEEIPPGTSPPQVPPKLLPQLSTGDGEYREVEQNERRCFHTGHKYKNDVNHMLKYFKYSLTF